MSITADLLTVVYPKFTCIRVVRPMSRNSIIELIAFCSLHRAIIPPVRVFESVKYAARSVKHVKRDHWQYLIITRITHTN